MNDLIKVTAAQASPIFLNKDKTVDKAGDLIKQAAAEKATLLILPEACIAGYPDWVWVVPNSKSYDLNNL